MHRGLICPGCGLTVAPGYPRCPRCQVELPRTSAPASPAAGPGVSAGGTALPESRRPTLLIAAAIIALAAAVTAVIILMSEGNGDERSSRDDGQQPASRVAPAPPVEARPAEPDEPLPPTAAATAGALATELQDRRLWATVEVDGDIAVVRTAYCADPGMDEALAAATAELKSSGIGGVRCHERHGPVVFERPLP